MHKINVENIECAYIDTNRPICKNETSLLVKQSNNLLLKSIKVQLKVWEEYYFCRWLEHSGVFLLKATGRSQISLKRGDF
jgi:hypothetical protein